MKPSEMAGDEFEKWQKNLPLGILSPSEYYDLRRTYLAGFYRAITLIALTRQEETDETE